MVIKGSEWSIQPGIAEAIRSACGVNTGFGLSELAQSLKPMGLDLLRQEKYWKELLARDRAAVDQLRAPLEQLKNLARHLQDPYARLREMAQGMRGVSETLRINDVHGVMARYESVMGPLSLQMAEIVKMTQAPRSLAEKIASLVQPTTSMFRAWHETIASLPTPMLDRATLLPMRERILTCDIVAHVSNLPAEHEEIDRDVFLEEAEQDIAASFPALGAVNPALYRLWQGAWGALHSSNPDKIRHTLVSMRELVTQVLHALSPDDSFARWDTAQRYYQNGRPTREGRLQYIYARIRSTDVREFLEADIRAAIELIRLFNSGTHTVKLNFTEAQLRVMLRKAHSMISVLVEIATNRNDN